MKRLIYLVLSLVEVSLLSACCTHVPIQKDSPTAFQRLPYDDAGGQSSPPDGTEKPPSGK